MRISRTDSTNNLVKAAYLDQPHLFWLCADYQTAGRGQTGNGWESEDGKNLLMSVLLRDTGIRADQAWQINMAVSLAVQKVVEKRTGNRELEKGECCIKWPNDIYVGDRKVCGILIENMLEGAMIGRSIVGIGLNINQTEWPSDLPNPISLKQITGQENTLDALAEEIVAEINRQMRNPQLRSDYMAVLYRREGWHGYSEQGTENRGLFEARIVDIKEQGEIVLQQRDGTEKTYHFKQIKYIITI